MRAKSSKEIRLLAERLLISAAGSFCSEYRSRRKRDRAHLLLEAAALADRREAIEKQQRAAAMREADAVPAEASA